jgi:anti-sigma factor RsiW
MSGEDQIENRECGADVAAYALGALDAEELTRFRSHLETCAVCRDELSAFQQIVDVLPMSAPTFEAPASLRRRVLDAIEDEPKLDPASVQRRSQASRKRSLRFRMPRPALAFSAGLTLAAAIVAVVIAVGSSPAPGTRTIDAQVTGQGTAALQVSKDHAQLVVHRFAAPPAGQIYEVWLQHGKGALQPTTALFSVTGQGDADVDVPGNLHGVSHVLVTREPAGGTSKPTHTPVITADLT